ncbi:MAG: hypothetical protein J0L63_19280, partial [Anaerolineae bacterium]|nr:hypothetical protein [Anaerolineae bacterium]
GGNPPPVQPPVFSPALAPLQPNPFGTGNPRVQIVILDRQLILQCQSGEINCALLNRRRGAGLR